MSKKKVKIQLSCTYGDKKSGDIISVDEEVAKEMFDQGMAVKPPKNVAPAASGSGDTAQLKTDLQGEKDKVVGLEKDLQAEKDKVVGLEKATTVHEGTIETLGERIENGGNAFDAMTKSILELDFKADDLPAKVEALQKFLGKPAKGKASKK